MQKTNSNIKINSYNYKIFNLIKIYNYMKIYRKITRYMILFKKTKKQV